MGMDEMRIGWARADITPAEPVIIAGQFHVRLPEAEAEPLQAAVLVLERGGVHVVFVSCDLSSISVDMEEAVRERIRAVADGPDADAIMMNATHTHTAPEIRSTLTAQRDGRGVDASGLGVELPIMSVERYVAIISDRIADAVLEAWKGRQPGKVAWGLDFAVVGRNRRWVDANGTSTMYGNIAVPHFSHIEGYEDHAVNVLATYGMDGDLTGVVVNVPCPSQVSEQEFRISPDYWHETRMLLRARYGDALHILPQCSAAGDQSPRPFYDKDALARMERLRGQSLRGDIAARIARAVTDTLDVIAPEAASGICLVRESVQVPLPLNALTEKDVEDALENAARLDAEHAAELARLNANPDLMREPRWYVKLTSAHRRANWHRNVATRYEQLAHDPTRAVTIHGVRLGDIAFASNPFELYLDYGIRIKARSPFLQTFLIQLAGTGTYVPSPRSVAGGGYGSVPASNHFGPEGGKMLVEETLSLLGRLREADAS